MTAYTDTRIQVRTTTELKDAATATLARMGLDMPTAINMYLRQIVNRQELPFTPTALDVNAQARYEAEHGVGRSFDTVDQLMADLNSDD